MTENRLERYRATKLEIAQLEERIHQARSKGPQMISDVVTSAASFPYNKHAVLISGFDVDGYKRREERMQKKRITLVEKAQQELEELENYIAMVPDSLIRVILRYRYIDGLGWLSIASRCGWGDAGTPRKKIQKYLTDS